MKDYQGWHKKKTSIEHNQTVRPFFYEREVRWCSVGVNIGFEQDGSGEKFARPVLILKKFNNEICWALPVSTKVKTGRFYKKIYLPDNIERVVIISQMRLIDAKRLMGYMGAITVENYALIQKAITNLVES